MVYLGTRTCLTQKCFLIVSKYFINLIVGLLCFPVNHLCFKLFKCFISGKTKSMYRKSSFTSSFSIDQFVSSVI